MTDNAKRLLKIYMNLSDVDKKEILEKIKNYDSSTVTEKTVLFSQTINESRILGPVATGSCPFCGR